MGAAADLAATDVVPLMSWWLGQHPAVAEALGQAGHVSMRNEAPWPCLMLTDTTAGSDGDLYLVSPEIQLEAYGDLDGNPGKAALRRLLASAVGAARELADEPCPYPAGAPDGSPVVTWVQSSRAIGWSPLPGGQPRYIGAVRVFCHPAT